MPMFTKMERMKLTVTLVRSFLDQKSCGLMTLHDIMIQYAHQYWPNARLMKAKLSYSLPEYHAMKNSMPYAYPTRVPVSRMILFMFSMCLTVMMCLRPSHARAGKASVCTMAKPEKIAPATKYGGKIVVCQPGSCETAKSKETTVCTESTSGAEKQAMI